MHYCRSRSDDGSSLLHWAAEEKRANWVITLLNLDPLASTAYPLNKHDISSPTRSKCTISSIRDKLFAKVFECIEDDQPKKDSLCSKPKSVVSLNTIDFHDPSLNRGESIVLMKDFSQGMSALHSACMMGCHESVQALLAAGNAKLRCHLYAYI